MDRWRFARWAMYGFLTVGAFIAVQAATEEAARADDRPVAAVLQQTSGLVDAVGDVAEQVTEQATGVASSSEPRPETKPKARPGHAAKPDAKPERQRKHWPERKREKKAPAAELIRDATRSVSGTGGTPTPRERPEPAPVRRVLESVTKQLPAPGQRPCDAVKPVRDVVDQVSPVVDSPASPDATQAIIETAEWVLGPVLQGDLVGSVVDPLAPLSPAPQLPTPGLVDELVPSLGIAVPVDLAAMDIIPATFWYEPTAPFASPVCVDVAAEGAPGVDEGPTRKKKVRRDAALSPQCPLPADPPAAPGSPALIAAGAAASATSGPVTPADAAAPAAGVDHHLLDAFRVVWPADETATGHTIRPGTSPA